MVPGAVDSWLDEIAKRSDGRLDPALVRLSLAVTRGLLLDLVATGDEEGVDAAAALYASMLRR